MPESVIDCSKEDLGSSILDTESFLFIDQDEDVDLFEKEVYDEPEAMTPEEEAKFLSTR